MARPKKNGLDYFPLDVDIFEDEKIEAISGEFGMNGELAVIKILCAIYKKGYYIKWDDLTQAQLARRLPDTDKETLNEIVNRLVDWGFFDKEVFDKNKVLTSKRIQSTFMEATRRRSGEKPTLYLVNVDNNPTSSSVNAGISTQRKGKEIKEEEIKEEEIREDILAPTSIEGEADCEVVKFFIPLKSGSFHSITDDKLTEYKKLFPNIDVEQEFRNMIAWCDANPQKRKTIRGVDKFIASWLTRTQGQVKTAPESMEEQTARMFEDWGGAK